MFAAVKALGLAYKLSAVYKVDGEGDEIENPPWPPIDDFSSYYDDQYLLLWDDFSGLSTNDLEFYAGRLLVVLCRAGPDQQEGETLIGELQRLGGRVDFTLVWAHYPATTTEACKFIGYGNEPSIKVVYVAAALIIDIPRFGTYRRHGTFH